MHTKIANLVQARNALVGVIGLGYVGLPFALEKAKVGFKVLGFDLDQHRVDALNRGENHIPDVKDAELAEAVKAGSIVATTDMARMAECDVLVICVPTPLTKNHTPDLGAVTSATRAIAKHLRPGQLISLESTTYPGTTEEVMLPILEATGLKVEQDFFLAHSPERVDPGNARYTTKNTNKVVGGVGPHSLEVAVAFYRETIEHVVPVSSAKAAELVKVYENTFRAVNIALVNELAMLCDRMDLNVWEVLEAAFTKPFGIMPFFPGPGVGGHCIPIDPHYLEWKAKEVDFQTRFISLAGEINRTMPHFVRDKVHRTLNRLGLAPSRARILCLGAAYKADLGDWRESPALVVMGLLQADGTEVRYHDPHVPHIEGHGLKADLNSVPLTDEEVAAADLVLLLTDHKKVDLGAVLAKAKAVVDTRNAFKKLPDPEHKVVIL